MAKKVLILSGSPRKNGNSDLLCNEFMRGALESGNEVTKIRVAEKKIAPCMAGPGLLPPLSLEAEASVPWKHEYHLRGDEEFQAHARRIIETGVTAPSTEGEVYYAARCCLQ